MVVHFCPNCWNEVGAHDRACSNCSYDLSTYNDLSYEEKLILAIQHCQAAFVHLQKDERELALSVIQDARDKLAGHASKYFDFDLTASKSQVDQMLHAASPKFFRIKTT